MSGAPTTWLAPSADGRLELFVVGFADGVGVEAREVFHLYQIAPGGGWSSWVSHGCPPGPQPYFGNPTVAPGGDRRLELFFGYSGSIWHIWQTAPNNGWTPTWTSHGAPTADDSGPGAPTLLRGPDGRLHLFVVDPSTEAVWHIDQVQPGGGWSGWTSLGSPSSDAGLWSSAPVANLSADGRIEVFAVGADGQLWHVWETAVGGGWSSWTSHGPPPGTTLLGTSPAMAPNAAGRLELFVVGVDETLWHIWQTAPSGGWSPWTSHQAPTDGLSIDSSPALALNAQGRLELFICANDGALWHIWQTSPSGGWSPWTSHGRPPSTIPGTPYGLWGTPAVALNSQQRLEVFVGGSDAGLWHIWQVAPGGG